MGSYASGKHARFKCIRCGFTWPYKDQRREWTGTVVCPECFEAKHPQLTPPRVSGDAIALRRPFPREHVYIQYLPTTADAILVKP